MKLKRGDKVRFLNESLEGEVIRILSQDRVEVTDTFGFTHITDEKLLVKADFELQKGDPALLKEEVKNQEPLQPIPQKPNGAILPALSADETIYAAVRMHDPDSPLTTDIDLILVNNTGLHLLFSVSKQNGDMRKGIDAGTLQSRQERFLGVFSQDELHSFNGFEFQFLFYNNLEFRPRPPAVKKWSVTSTDFLDNEYRSRLKGFDESVLLMPLYLLNPVDDADISKLLEKYQQQEELKQVATTESKKEKKSSEKFIGLSRHKVVDLHIEELLKDSSSMNNAQIISYQVNYFLYELDQALLNRLNKITFIHGVGQGVLKSAIREELKRYPEIRYGDAPPEKYGYGATEVELL